MDHEYTRDIPSEVKATVLIHEQHSSSAVAVWFVCTTGTHKSVAGGRLAKESFAMDGYHTTVTHLSAGNWASRNKCSWCKNCDVNSHYKQEIFDYCDGILKSI